NRLSGSFCTFRTHDTICLLQRRCPRSSRRSGGNRTDEKPDARPAGSEGPIFGTFWRRPGPASGDPACLTQVTLWPAPWPARAPRVRWPPRGRGEELMPVEGGTGRGKVVPEWLPEARPEPPIEELATFRPLVPRT